LGKPSSCQLAGVFLLQFALVVGLCQAENLPDPTRPPSSLGPLPSAYGEEPDNAPAPVPVLQSIMLSATRKAAMISGQTVVLGEKFGEARLVKLTPSEAVLRTEEGLQVLKLFPDVEKKERLVPPDEDKSGKKNRDAALENKANQ
jgi:MSHA biogenesis protein MshK